MTDASEFRVRAPTRRTLTKLLASGAVTALYGSSFDALAGESLFHFTVHRERLHPLSVLVHEETLAAAQEGMRVRFEFPGIELGRRRLVFAGLVPSPRRPRPDRVMLAANLDRLRRFLNTFGRKSGSLDELALALSVFREQRRIDALELIGCFGAGEGLTPAFDDFFSGMLLVDRWLRRRAIRTGRRFFELLARRTTRQSVWQIRFADQGRSALAFEHLLARMLTAPLSVHDVLPCLAIGHTSGCDILSGIEAYLSALPE